MNRAPKHIAIIMDGNGRWAQNRNKPRTYGHIKGARVARSIITECAQKGVETLTLYAFSTENWLRPEAEVSFLMRLLKRYLDREKMRLVKENIQFSVIGDIQKLPNDAREEILSTIKLTQKNTGMRLVFAVSYGGRQEIINMVKNIAQKVANKELHINDITSDVVATHLSTFPAPDPDIIIRTSGESRLSNFLSWQSAYSELYFCDTLWPDFKAQDLQQAIDWFKGRQRRFGQVLPKAEVKLSL